MYIRWLQITAFRNLAETRIEPGARINQLIGPNGAGKTSLLEAIHFLGTGRSFRQAGSEALRQVGSTETLLVGEIGDGGCHRLGVRLSGQRRVLRLDGYTESSFAALAQVLKTIHYSPEGHQLIAGGPRERRQFLDWGLFHVKPEFLRIARRYSRALQQRNRWLKEEASGPDPWLTELASVGEEITRLRREYLSHLEEHVQRLFPELGGFGHLSMYLDRGWSSQRSLQEALKRDYSRESGGPVTQSGPHRADLVVKLDGLRAREHASRGQQKLLLLALRLAQLILVTQQTGRAPLFLLDDMSSELDEQRRAAVIEILDRYGEQVFVSSTDEAFTPLPSHRDVSTFYLDAGAIRPFNGSIA